MFLQTISVTKCINIQRVERPNCIKFDSALPDILCNQPAECEVDLMNGSWDLRVTDGQNHTSV